MELTLDSYSPNQKKKRISGRGLIRLQDRLGHDAPRAPPPSPQLELLVTLLEEHLYAGDRAPRPIRGDGRLGELQERCLSGLVGHVDDDAGFRAEEGGREEQRIGHALVRR